MKKIVVAGVVSAVLALVVGAGAGWGVWHHYAGKGKPTAVARTEAVETLDESKSVFVTLPETIVTLHDNNGADHYLSAELVMVVASDKEAEKIKHQEPLYQSIAVECLTEMKFEDLRGMKISAIRKLISDALKKDLQRRKMTAPYKDLLVKKAVFQ
ncbi:flagellar basal body-associated FliL family protein [Escherichia coli]|nr:flagellar basal body-associated FliL family protein [Escherichia coli]